MIDRDWGTGRHRNASVFKVLFEWKVSMCLLIGEIGGQQDTGKWDSTCEWNSLRILFKCMGA